jgi:hypothetical protein
MRALAVLALAAIAAAPAAAPAATAKGPQPLLGIVFKAKKPQLARLDPATLAPLGRSGLPAGGSVPVWSYSPDRTRLALGAEAPLRIRIFDVGEMSQVASMKLTGAGGVIKIAWLRPDRLVAVYSRPDGARIVWIDPKARRVLKRAVLDVAPGAIAVGGDMLAAFLPPAAGPGSARLVVATADGSLREVAVPAIPISVWASPTGEPFTRISPALAIDPSARTAYAIGTNGVAAAIDLDSLRVTTHILGRQLAKSMNGEELQARWLGDGILAVAGQKYDSSVDANGNETTSQTPLGLRLIDVRTWSARMIDPGATGFALAADGLVAYGTASSWAAGVLKLAGMGLVAYRSDGSPVFRVLAGRPVGMVQTAGGRAYAWVAGTAAFHVAVVDLASGAVERERDLPPMSLLADF